MDRNKNKGAATPNDTPHIPGDKKAAARLSEGLTLVPYYAYNERGERCAYCAWVRLQPGESVAQAAGRLSVPPRGK